MDIYRAERLAQDKMVAGGDWDKSFTIVGPLGSRIDCEWLDPYFGMFQVKGKEGFMMSKSLPDGCDIEMESV